MKDLNPVQVSFSKPAELKKQQAGLIWLFLILFLIASLIGFGLYITKSKALNTEKKSHAETASQLKTVQEELKTAAFPLPRQSDKAYECDGGEKNVRFSQVNKDPIQGYRMYLLTCLNSASKDGKNIQIESEFYREQSDGSLKFIFGSGIGQPFCVSQKSLPVEVATEFVKISGFPICSDYYGA